MNETATGRWMRVSGGTALGLLLLVLSTAAPAATLTVTTLSDSLAEGEGAPSGCTLRAAMANAQANFTANLQCPAVGAYGADVIVFAVSGTILLNQGLPVVADTAGLEIAGDVSQHVVIDGGGLFRPFTVTGGSLNLIRLTVQNGSTPGDGGAVLVSSGTLALLQATLTGNSAGGHGGAVRGDADSTVVGYDVTFAGNSAAISGGAVSAVGDQLLLVNTTIVGNDAPAGAGALEIGGNASPGLANSILFGNTGEANCDQGFGDGAAENDIEDADTCGFGASSLTDVADAGLDTGLKDNGGPTPTIALRAGSRAIDFGDDELCSIIDDGSDPLVVPGVDQRGEPRFVGVHCDAGAYEFSQSDSVPGEFPHVKGAGAVSPVMLLLLLAAAGARRRRS